MNFKKHIGILSVFIVIASLIIAPVFAGDDIPSKKQLEYAKNLYSMVHQFDKKEDAFVESLKSVPIYETSKIDNAFKNKFNYTKKLYLDIMALEPTSKFEKVHQQFLEALYGNLQYLKIVNNELAKGIMINNINQKHNSILKKSNNVYESASTDFMAIVKSWQKPYIDQVKPSNNAK